MSIIDDALKKTQLSLQQQEQLDRERSRSQCHQVDEVLQRYEGEKNTHVNKLLWSAIILMALLLMAQLVHSHWLSGFSLKRWIHSPVHTVVSHKPVPHKTARHAKPALMPLSHMRLLGVVADSNQRMAMINQQTVHVGDHFGGYLVQGIFDDTVVLFDGKLQHSLHVTL